MNAGLRRAGLAIVALYIVVAAATQWLAGHPVRPLFDGFAPPVPYNWVTPPPEFAAGNVAPRPTQAAVALGEQGSDAANVSTDDAQIFVSLAQGALAAHPPDTSVDVRLTPLDAKELGSLPPKLRVVANAYEVKLVYQPSQTPITQVGAASTIAMTAGTKGDTLLHSADGQEWQAVPAQPFGATDGVTGQLTAAGYYLVAASPAIKPATEPKGGFSRVTWIVGGIAYAAVTVIGIVKFRRYRRLKRSRTRQQQRQAERRKEQRRGASPPPPIPKLFGRRRARAEAEARAQAEAAALAQRRARQQQNRRKSKRRRR